MPQKEEDAVRLERVRWRSRRGLLELELLLARFLEGGFSALPDEQKAAYEALLDFDDMDVHEWLLARRPVPTAVEPIIVEIRRCLGLS